MCLCIDSEKISFHQFGAEQLELEVRDWLGRGKATSARRQKSYRRSVKEGDARGDPRLRRRVGKTLRLKNGGHADFEGASPGAVGM